MFLTESGKYTKLKKPYYTEDGKFAKLKNVAYLTEEGKFVKLRLGGELKYYGTAPDLSSSLSNASGATAGDYALFAGGARVVNAYNSKLTKVDVPQIDSGSVAHRTEAVSMDNTAFFHCSYTTSKYEVAMQIYNSALTKITGSAPGYSRYNVAGATAGDYALFAGGSNPDNTYSSGVVGWDTSGTLKRLTNLTSGYSSMCGASIGEYALFAGGSYLNGQSNFGNKAVFVYDKGLTKLSNSNYLAKARTFVKSARAGRYVLFAGGYDIPSNLKSLNNVDAFDTSLTKISVASLQTPRHYHQGATLGDYALFVGGYNYDSDAETRVTLDSVEVYDSSLTLVLNPELKLPNETQNMASATLGDYALFAGGRSNTGITGKKVEVFALA